MPLAVRGGSIHRPSSINTHNNAGPATSPPPTAGSVDSALGGTQNRSRGKSEILRSDISTIGSVPGFSANNFGERRLLTPIEKSRLERMQAASTPEHLQFAHDGAESPRMGFKKNYFTKSSASTVPVVVFDFEVEAVRAAEAPRRAPSREMIYPKTSCFCVPLDSRFRDLLIDLVEWPTFDSITIVVIMMNCITLAMYDPFDEDCVTQKCKILSYFDLFFTAFFTLECIIKLTAMGAYGKPNAYFRDSWNRFDFFIVIVGMIDLMPFIEGGILTLLRIFRVLRPLRAVNKMPSLRILIALILDTLPMLGSVVILSCFVTIVFAVLFLQLVVGVLHNRCFNDDQTAFYEGGEDAYLCYIDPDVGMATCGQTNYSTCLAKSTITGLEPPNPNYGVNSYDNMFDALVNVFLMLTMEGWTDQLFQLQDAYSFWVWIPVFALILIGSMLALNLFLVVITTQFSNTKAAQMAELAEIQEAENVKKAEDAASGEKPYPSCCSCLFSPDEEEDKAPVTVDAMVHPETDEEVSSESEPERMKMTIPMIEAAAIATSLQRASSSLEDEDAPEEEDTSNTPQLVDGVWDVSLELFEEYLERKAEKEAREEEVEAWETGGKFALIRLYFKRFVSHAVFGQFIMSCIGLNTLVMTIEFYKQPDGMTVFQEVMNYIFTAIFFFEMIFKMFGLGPKLYVADQMNVFDMVIVFSSLVELAVGGGGFLSVLRTFRLMRIFKLVRFLPGLQRQMAVIYASLGDVANFCLILLLFIFIYAIMGMYIFGAKFDFEDGEGNARSNFDNLFMSLVTVFQLLTIEDWPGVMYNGVRAVGKPCCLYFISLLIIGNFVLTNLFVAILLDGFAEKAEEEAQAIREAASGVNQNKAVIRLKGFMQGMLGKNRAYMWKKWQRAVFAAAQGVDVDELQSLSSSVGAIKVISRDNMEGVNAQDQSHSSPRNPRSAASQAPQHLTGGPRPGSSSGDTGSAAGAGVGAVQLFSNLVVGVASAPKFGIGTGTGTTPLSSPTEQDRLKLTEDASELTLDPQGEKQEVHRVIEGKKAEESDEESDFEEEPETYWCDHGNNLFCLGPDNCLRVFCERLVADPKFDQVILATIGLSSICMAIEMPAISDDSTIRLVLTILGFMFTAIFTFEMFFKVVAWGLFCGETAYIHGGWNRLDGFIVLVSWVDTTFYVMDLESGGLIGLLRILRLLRTLRPLRVIARAPKLKMVVNTLIISLNSIGDTLMIASVLFLIFAILGMQLFSGGMQYCDDAEGNRLDSVEDMNDCQDAGGTVGSIDFNYDNIGNSLLTLFYVSSLDGWVDQMQNGVDVVGPGKNMKAESNVAISLFFVSFILIGNFFILNMFVGVIVDSFQRSLDPSEILGGSAPEEITVIEEEEEEDSSFLNDYPEWRLSLFNFQATDRFDVVISAVIVLNLITMSCEHYQSSSDFNFAMDMLNFVYTSIFTFEAGVKIVALGFCRYIAVAWNKFDFFIVIVSFAGIAIEESGTEGMNPAIIRVLRILRIARIMKLLKTAQGLKDLVDTVFESMVQVANIGLLLGLFFFIYGCAGVEMYGKIQSKGGTWHGSPGGDGDGFSKNMNFTNIGMALLTLMKICTGDNGNGFLRDAMRQPPDCYDDVDCEEFCCANQIIAPLFFLSFTVLAQFVLLNVVVAVLMAQLEESAEANDAALNEAQSELAKEGADLDKVQAIKPVIEGPLVRMARHRSRSLQSPGMRTVQLAGLQDAIEKKAHSRRTSIAESTEAEQQQAGMLATLHERSEAHKDDASSPAGDDQHNQAPDGEETPVTQLVDLNHVGVTKSPKA